MSIISKFENLVFENKNFINYFKLLLLLYCQNANNMYLQFFNPSNPIQVTNS